MPAPSRTLWNPFAAALAASLLASTAAHTARADLKVDPSTLRKLEAPSKLTAERRAGTPGDQVALEAVLRDAAGQPLAGRAVAFESPGLFNGSGQTDALGKAVYGVRIPDGTKGNVTYRFTAAFAGDATHGASKASQALWVVKGLTKITISDLQLVYNEGKNKGPGVPIVTVHVVRALDGKPIPSASIDVVINGAPAVQAYEPHGTNLSLPGNGPWTLDCQSHETDSYQSAHAARTLTR